MADIKSVKMTGISVVFILLPLARPLPRFGLISKKISNFYKNPSVRNEMDKAIEQQAGIIDPRKKIIDHAMENQISLLEQQVASLKIENGLLKKENQKLKKAL
ncbi:MAG: hypothetical protein J1E62_01975 [Lachnospiraceae bacterium]|nr:hypothetical protein [Lachnospiraceae bacterium]